MKKMLLCYTAICVAGIFSMNCAVNRGNSAFAENVMPTSEANGPNNPKAEILHENGLTLVRIGQSPPGEGTVHVAGEKGDTIWLWRDRKLWRGSKKTLRWELIYYFEDEYFSWIDDVKFEDEKAGWLLIASNLYRTLDGGATWNKVKHFDDFDGTLDSITISPDRKTVLIGGSREISREIRAERAMYGYTPAIFKTQNKGLTWQVKEIPEASGSITRIQFIDSSRVVAIGEAPEWVYFSSNNGKEWREAKFSSKCVRDDYYSAGDFKPAIIYSDGRKLWLGFDNGRIMESTDGGESWCDKSLPEDVWKESDGGLAFFRTFCSFDKDTLIGLKKNGDLYSTVNGGDTWTLINSVSGNGDLLSSDNSCVYFSDNEIWLIKRDERQSK